MKTLLEKEEKLIKEPIKNFVSNYLSNDFNLKSGKIIQKINEVRIGDIIVDTEKSDFKKQIIINKIEIATSLTIQLTEYSFKDETISLLLTKAIHLEYANESKNYNIVNADNFTLVDIEDYNF